MVSSTQMGSGAVADIIAEMNDAIEPGETIRRASVASLLVPLKSRYSVLLIISIAAALIRMSGSPKPLLLVTAPREPGIRRLLPMDHDCSTSALRQLPNLTIRSITRLSAAYPHKCVRLRRGGIAVVV